MTLNEILILGVIGGISPGPITALMLGETFKHGLRKGIMVPAALLFSNVLIGGMALGLFFLGRDFGVFLEVFTYLGAAVLIWMGVQELRASAELNLSTASNPFRKAILIEVGNPHPYVFWFTVLAPSIVLSTQESGLMAIPASWLAFVIGLVGTKILVVCFADFIRAHLKPTHILWINRVLALALIAFGVSLLI